MFEPTRVVAPTYKRPMGTDGHCGKRHRTTRDMCPQVNSVVTNGNSSITVYSTPLYMFNEQDIGEEHVVEVGSELDHEQAVTEAANLIPSNNSDLSNADGNNSKQDVSAYSMSSSDTCSSVSANSLSGPRRDPEVDKALQRKREPLYFDKHLNNAGTGMKDTVWDEDVYKTEIIQNLVARERNRFPLSGRSAYIEHRGKILSWMLNAAKTLKLSIEVIQLAVYFYDRFVDHATRLFLGDKLEMQVLTCLQLAAKSIEWDHHIPRGSDLNSLLVSPYELSEYVRAERQMLLFFQWNVCVPVLNTFLGYFRDYLLENVKQPRTRQGLLDIAEYFDKSTLYHIILQSLPCSQLALAIIVACRTLVGVQPHFPVSLRTILPYEENQQMHWAGFLVSLLERDCSVEAFKIRSQYGVSPQKPSLARSSSRPLPSATSGSNMNVRPRSNCGQSLHVVHPLAQYCLPSNPPPNTRLYSASASLSGYRQTRGRKKTVTVINHDLMVRPYNSMMTGTRNNRRERQTAPSMASSVQVSSLNSRSVQGKL